MPWPSRSHTDSDTLSCSSRAGPRISASVQSMNAG